jgi:hypothetical protein
MAFKLGSTDINKVYLGSTEINSIYLGSTEVYSGAAAYTPLLDSLSATPDFAWSFWQLSTSQTNCIRIREDVTNNETDIGFVNGYIDVASINAFLTTYGASNAYGVTLYDASSNANHASETISANQYLFSETAGVDGQAALINQTNSQSVYSFGTQITAYSQSDSTIFVNTAATTATADFYFTTASNRGYIVGRPAAGIWAFQPNANFNSSISLNTSTDYYTRIYWDGATVNFDVNSSTQSASYTTIPQSMKWVVDVMTPIALSGCLTFNAPLSSGDASTLKAFYNSQFNKSI